MLLRCLAVAIKVAICLDCVEKGVEVNFFAWVVWLYFDLTYGQEKVGPEWVFYQLVDHVSFRLLINLPRQLRNLQHHSFNLPLLVAYSSFETLYLLLLYGQLGLDSFGT